MKRIIFALSFLIVASFAFQGCEKGNQCNYTSNFPPTSKNSSESFVMYVDYNDIHSEYRGEDIDKTLLWYRYNNGNLENRSYISFALEDVEDAKYEFRDSVLYVTTNSEIFRLSNFIYEDNLFKFIASGYNNIPVKFSIYSQNFDLSQYKSNEKVDPLTAVIIIYGAACLIAAGVDYYCDNKIAREVAECTAQGLCSKVHSCGAECLECKKPKN